MSLLPPSATLEDVFEHLNKVACTAVLFLDQSERCREYSKLSWVRSEAELVDLNYDILDAFQIGKVPQFRFYVQGNEVGSLIGTVTAETFLEMKRKVFQNVSSMRHRTKAVFTDLEESSNDD